MPSLFPGMDPYIESSGVWEDFLRRGQRMPMVEEWPASPYYVLTCWKRSAPACKVWPAFFDRPLPKLHVPLTPSDADLTLDLQPMVDSIYDHSRYAVDTDYRRHVALRSTNERFFGCQSG